jgi:membrane associated rhomboid family serine protease
MYRFGSGRRSATLNLILTNVIIFVLFLILPRSLRQQLYALFGLTPAHFATRPWMIFTAMFLHADIGHIFANMFTLYFFGDFVNHLVGERKFLLIYLVGGITGNIFQLLFAFAPLPAVLQAPMYVPAVGASGALFALGGTLAVMRPKVKVFVFPIPAPLPLWIAIVGGFLILSLIPGIAWQAHLGGLLFGAAFGYFLRGQERRIL